MNGAPGAAPETRRAPRRAVAGRVPVIDCMAGRTIGHLANVSESGMLLLAALPLREDALFQLRFALPLADGRQQPIDVGAHLLWREPARTAGQTWCGLRFLTLAEDHRELLRRWILQAAPAT